MDSEMCTLEKRGDIFILRITGGGEHRMNPTLIDSIRSALDRVKFDPDSSGPTALITTADGKFFSNGYDLSWALSDPAQAETRPKIMSKKLRLLVSDLISLPMPTIAAVTGHASAAGFILALSHDYLLMRKGRGFLYMSELDIGYKIPHWFTQIVKSKVASPKVWRDVVLKSARITAEMGVDWGIVDSAHEGVEETVDAAVRLGAELVKRKWNGKVYADNRRTVFADVLAALGSDETVGDPGEDGSVATSAGDTVSRL
ncbi:enoyl-CoA delta isomerase 1, peroxisomal [Henckelia pumila]|uniref:enoyl-CoA delta isomerase 1, peroxisomal n=1 Tax=Henckelia pumila TaxID=405737 RepID=UPI003C6E2A7F